MGYYSDLSSISIDCYRDKLKTNYLLPGRMLLKEKIDERFEYLKSLGIKNALDLQKMLKKKEKLAEISENKLFKGDYLTVLLREINSMHPKPNKLKDFTGISSQTISKLEKLGIKDTLGLYEKITDKEKRKKLAISADIPEKEINDLTRLTDLSRVKWVGATFARVLFETGYDTVEKLSKANPEQLYHSIIEVNKEKNLYKGNIGLNDMRLCVEVAREVSLEIVY